MGAPEYVPLRPAQRVRLYSSPPRRPDPWMATRPADLDDGQPVGPGLGSQGPDQGFAMRLAGTFESSLHLTDGEVRADVVAGGTSIALKRASMFGRAPVIHDLTLAFALFGFLAPATDDELVELRRRAFESVAGPHHYSELRRLVDSVPEQTLRLTHSDVLERGPRDWRTMLDVANLA